MTNIESQTSDEPNGDVLPEHEATEATNTAAGGNAEEPPVDPEEEARLLQRHLRPDPFNLMWVW